MTMKKKTKSFVCGKCWVINTDVLPSDNHTVKCRECGNEGTIKPPPKKNCCDGCR